MLIKREKTPIIFKKECYKAIYNRDYLIKINKDCLIQLEIEFNKHNKHS